MRLAGVERRSLTLGSVLTGTGGATCTTGLGAAGGSWVFSRVSTCSMAPILVSHLVIHKQRDRSGSRRTQSLLQSLDISTLWAALPPDLVIGTVMAQPRTCATARPIAVASELPLPTYHTCQALGLRYVGVVGWMGGRGACCRWATGFDLDSEGVLGLLEAIHGRVRVWRGGHRDRATDRPVGLRGQDGCAAASGRVRRIAVANAMDGSCLVRPEWPPGAERRGYQAALGYTVDVG